MKIFATSPVCNSSKCLLRVEEERNFAVQGKCSEVHGLAWNRLVFMIQHFLQCHVTPTRCQKPLTLERLLDKKMFFQMANRSEKARAFFTRLRVVVLHQMLKIPADPILVRQKGYTGPFFSPRPKLDDGAIEIPVPRAPFRAAPEACAIEIPVPRAPFRTASEAPSFFASGPWSSIAPRQALPSDTASAQSPTAEIARSTRSV